MKISIFKSASFTDIVELSNSIITINYNRLGLTIYSIV